MILQLIELCYKGKMIIYSIELPYRLHKGDFVNMEFIRKNGLHCKSEVKKEKKDWIRLCEQTLNVEVAATWINEDGILRAIVYSDIFI